MIQNNIDSIQHYFNDNSYVVVRNFLSPEICALAYEYCKIKAESMDFKYTYNRELYNEKWDGTWSDHQAPNAYSHYGDAFMEALLKLSHPLMQQYTGKSLSYNYSYWRLYQKGNMLDRHIDRASCEISTTLCLGYDASDVDSKTYPDYDWPMWVKDKTGTEIPIHMKPGDMIIYRGCELEHWRDKFMGKNHAQMFMHYNDNNGQYKINHDGRPMLGVPKQNSKLNII
jgi:hypothetical protein